MLQLTNQELLNNGLLTWTEEEEDFWIFAEDGVFNIEFNNNAQETYISDANTGQIVYTLDTTFDRFDDIFMVEKFEQLFYVHATDYTMYMEDFLESIFQHRQTGEYLHMNNCGQFNWVEKDEVPYILSDWRDRQRSSPGIALKKDVGLLIGHILAGNTTDGTLDTYFAGSQPKPWSFGFVPFFSKDYNEVWKLAAINFFTETDVFPPIKIDLGWFQTIEVVKEPKDNGMYYRIKLQTSGGSEMSYQYSDADLQKVLEELENFLSLPSESLQHNVDRGNEETWMLAGTDDEEWILVDKDGKLQKVIANHIKEEDYTNWTQNEESF